MNSNQMQLNASKDYILFRDDIEAPDGVKTVQMSKDMLEICGKALLQKGKLGKDSTWFWAALDPDKFHTSYIKKLKP